MAGAIVTAVGGTLLALGLTGNAGGNTLATILGGVLFAFIGVALLTPLISRPVVSLLGALFAWSVPGKLGRLNSGRNPRRTAITAAALMVGIALVTGVTVILDSAKSSIGGLAEDSLKAELVIAGAQSGPGRRASTRRCWRRPPRSPGWPWPTASTVTWRWSAESAPGWR